MVLRRPVPLVLRRPAVRGRAPRHGMRGGAKRARYEIRRPALGASRPRGHALSDVRRSAAAARDA
eukprot:11181156-Lingulodinium_polyedra.AAC.1